MPVETLEAYALGDLSGDALDLPNIGEFNWTDDGDPETTDKMVRRQTVFRTSIAGEPVSGDAAPWLWQYFIYDRTGYLYILSLD